MVFYHSMSVLLPSFCHQMDVFLLLSSFILSFIQRVLSASLSTWDKVNKVDQNLYCTVAEVLSDIEATNYHHFTPRLQNYQ